MRILAHRGLWHTKNEQNTLLSFEKSLKAGFGIETDLRDTGGGGVKLCHDAFITDAPSLDEFFVLCKTYPQNYPLALNVKADGLQNAVKKLIEKYQIQNYFFFDMSVPDALYYLKMGLKVFTRQSEYEKEPSFYSEACGVWLDEFLGHWIDEKTILKHLENKKQVAIVSPDLHKREFLKEWEHYRDLIAKHKLWGQIMLCTDRVLEAQEFFNV